MPKFYATYGWPLRNGVEYSVVEAPDYVVAKEVVLVAVGLWYGMLLSEAAFLRAANGFELGEVDLNA